MATEKRLINADELIETIRDAYCKECNNYGGVKCRACRWDDAMGMIEDAPTVDAVEAVQRWTEIGQRAIHESPLQRGPSGRPVPTD